MDLVVFENDKPYVISEFREGRFDYIELASDVAETKFFQFLFGQDLVDQLARDYPSPRKRHHVPLWMYVSSQLALRLHGSQRATRTVFASWPRIPIRKPWSSGTTGMWLNSTASWEPTRKREFSSAMVRICSCPTTRTTRARNACCSTNTTIP